MVIFEFCLEDYYFVKHFKIAFEENKYCIKPRSDLTIWRYMSLEKFELLLQNQALFFCRADRFSDPYEGSIPKEEAEYRIKNRRKISANFRQKFDEQKAQENIKAISNRHRNFKKQHIINCWHINNSENDSMWRLYLKSNEGVAIKTTVDKLLNSFANTPDKIYCSKVRYLDYVNDIWYDEIDYPCMGYNMLIPLVHKRVEFKQEEEIRLINDIGIDDDLDQFWEQQPNQKGKNIKVEIESLIDTIYSLPTSNEYQIKKIREIISNNNFDFNVQKSKLSIEPYY